MAKSGEPERKLIQVTEATPGAYLGVFGYGDGTFYTEPVVVWGLVEYSDGESWRVIEPYVLADGHVVDTDGIADFEGLVVGSTTPEQIAAMYEPAWEARHELRRRRLENRP